MEPWEIMISESQERMVAAVRPEQLERGRGGDRALGAPLGGDRRGHGHGRAARVPRRRRRRRDPRAPPHGRVPALRGRARPRPSGGRLRSIRVNHEPKRWVYEQYDQLVGSRTVRRPGLDAAVLRLRPVVARARRLARRAAARRARPAPAGRAGRARARRGTSPAPAASRSRSPTASTSATPRSPRSRWELAEAIEGIAQAAEALGIPVVSGNVSLYNETDGRAIPPTPVVGCVGLVPDVRACRAAGGRATRVCVCAEGSTRRRADRVRSGGRAALLPRPRRLGRRTAARARGGGGVERRRRSRLPGDGAVRLGRRRLRRERPRLARAVRRARDGALMCGVFGIRAPGPRRRPRRALRPARAPAPRPGGGRDRRLGRRAADGAARARPAHAVSRSRSSAASTATSRSATRATRRPARARGRTPSRSSSTGARARSRSGTTATSSTPPSCGRSSPRRACGSSSTSDSELIAALIANDPRAARGGGRERWRGSRARTR